MVSTIVNHLQFVYLHLWIDDALETDADRHLTAEASYHLSAARAVSLMLAAYSWGWKVIYIERAGVLGTH